MYRITFFIFYLAYMHVGSEFGEHETSGRGGFPLDPLHEEIITGYVFEPLYLRVVGTAWVEVEIGIARKGIRTCLFVRP